MPAGLMERQAATHGAGLDNSGPGHEDDIYETVFVYIMLCEIGTKNCIYNELDKK
jgi:hypothetical protein